VPSIFRLARLRRKNEHCRYYVLLLPIELSSREQMTDLFFL